MGATGIDITAVISCSGFGFPGHNNKVPLYLAQLIPMNVLPTAAKTLGQLSGKRSGGRWQ
jgi:hypothetical protein